MKTPGAISLEGMTMLGGVAVIAVAKNEDAAWRASVHASMKATRAAAEGVWRGSIVLSPKMLDCRPCLALYESGGTC